MVWGHVSPFGEQGVGYHQALTHPRTSQKRPSALRFGHPAGITYAGSAARWRAPWLPGCSPDHPSPLPSPGTVRSFGPDLPEVFLGHRLENSVEADVCWEPTMQRALHQFPPLSRLIPNLPEFF